MNKERMNKTIELIKTGREKGISIFLQEENLQLKVSKDRGIDTDFLNELKTYKADIISFLKTEAGNQLQFTETVDPIVPVNRAPGSAIPLSFSQEGAWFVDKLHGDRFHKIPLILQLSGTLHIPALQYAFAGIVGRHEALRTVIRERDGIPYQEIIPAEGFSIHYQKELPKGLNIKHYIEQEVGKSFNLSADYMIRASLVRTGDAEHILVIVLHHIAFDGWCQSIFASEIAELYQAFLNNRPSVLKPLSVQYADYSIWQRKYLESKLFKNGLDYWARALADTKPLDLPADYSRSRQINTAGNIESIFIDAPLAGQLQKLARQEDVTLFMMMLSAFKMLLSRYSNMEDICIGSPLANRTQKETEPLIGYFVNTIPIRTQVKTTQPFLQLLQEVKQNVLNGYTWQHVPLEKIISRVVNHRSPDRHPLFQVVFVLQSNETVKPLQLDGLMLSQFDPLKLESTEFDLTCTAMETAEGIHLTLAYRTDLFQPATVQAMLKNYQTLLEAIVESPLQPVGRLNIISGQERKRVLIEYNNTRTEYPREQTIVQLFEKQAAATPNATALVFENSTLQYSELNKRANQLAHFLRKKGVGKGSIVAIAIGRSTEMIVGLMAILKAGAAYVAIPVQFPAHRIRFILQDTEAQWVLTSREYRTPINDITETGIIDMEEEQQNMATQPVHDLTDTASPEDLIYFVYTSGSTGNPKAVMTAHKHLVNYLYAMADRLQMDEKDSFLALASYGFDGSCFEIYLPLMLGSKVIIASQEAVTDGFILQKTLTRHQPAYLQATPTALRLLIDSGWRNETGAIIISGGEPINEKLRDQLISFSDQKVWNFYGPTETTLYATMQELKLTEKITIGKPIPNYSIVIADEYLQPVPVGVAGELYIGGAGVAAGYWNRPELTAEKFVTNPFSEIPGGVLYRTGDLGKWDQDGKVQLIGRIDNQVKIRGFRIEPGEIEDALLHSGMVKQCLVIAKDSQSGEKQLVAYILPTNTFHLEQLLDYLKTTLPDYMVPAFLITVDHFKKNANGKLDKEGLPDPEPVQTARSGYMPPANELQQELVNIWEELLGVQRIGIEDNFFELGGNSLLAVRLMARLRKKFNREFPVTLLFEYATIASLGTRLITENGEKNTGLLTAINPAGSQVPIFCTPAVGGEPVTYYELSKMLGSNQPLYAFSARGLDARNDPHQSIEEMATAYLEEIEALFIQGPIILAGYSFGGHTAYEMARLCHLRGIPVSKIIIFEALAPNTTKIDYTHILPATYAEWLLVMINIVNHSFRLPEEKRVLLTMDELTGKSEDGQFDYFYDKVAAAGIDVTREQLAGHINVYIRNSHISYVPASYPLSVPVILFTTSVRQSVAFNQQAREKSEQLFQKYLVRDDLGWNDYTTYPVALHKIGCTHQEMMEQPHIQQIANYLREHLYG
jgi:amino acid adenylation domain-containing protein